MVENNLFERDVRGMAAGALLSQLPAMGIGMTGRAARILEQEGFSFFSCRSIGRSMAGIAIGHFFMQSAQGKTGFVMRKFLHIPVDQFKIFAMMFRMASDAAIGFVPVPAALGFDPLRQVAMAGQAFLRVNLFFCGMALRAVANSG